MDRWFQSSFAGPAERPALPPSVQGIAIDDNAIWADLCDEDQWKPLQGALQHLIHLVRTPRMLQEVAVDSGEWTLAHLAVVFEIERLHYLLIARQLSDRIQDLSWEEPLASLLHGLDVAVASAMETGRRLAVEMHVEDIEPPDEGGPWTANTDEEDIELPEWGKGYAYVLYRRFVAEVQSVLDLLSAVCEAAYDDEGSM